MPLSDQDADWGLLLSERDVESTVTLPQLDAECALSLLELDAERTLSSLKQDSAWRSSDMEQRAASTPPILRHEPLFLEPIFPTRQSVMAPGLDDDQAPGYGLKPRFNN